jgi:Mn-containing catalase
MATAVEAVSGSYDLDTTDVMGLLKAIAAGEAEGGRRLAEWAALTSDPKLAATLRFIATRENSHVDLFSRRVSELGETVDVGVVPAEAAYLSMLADPAVAESEKAACVLGGAEFFADVERRIEAGAYDPLTAKLLAFYVAEERDSQDRLRRTGVAG